MVAFATFGSVPIEALLLCGRAILRSHKYSDTLYGVGAGPDAGELELSAPLWSPIAG